MGSVLLAGGQDSRTECSARHQHFFFSSSSSEPFFNPKPPLFQQMLTMINHWSVPSDRPPWDSISPIFFESLPFLLSSFRLTSSGCRLLSHAQSCQGNPKTKKTL